MHIEATLIVFIEVQGVNKATARAAALRQLTGQPIDWSKARVSQKLKTLKRKELQD